MTAQNILVIKHGALGDFILAQSAFAAIRRHHHGAQIALLTTQPFAEMARAAPYFDSVWVDDKPRGHQPGAWLKLARRLRKGAFTRVYDLQTSGRSSFYYRLFWPRYPEWAGIAPGCSHPDPTSDRAAVHAYDLRLNQLKAAGITDVPFDDLSWLGRKPPRHDPPTPYILLVPGASKHRPEKRWPVGRYAALARLLVEKAYTPVILGDDSEAQTAEAIRAAAPQAIDLTGKTTLFDLADLGRAAAGAVGNDTGPMHLLAATGCPVLVLFSGTTAPHHSLPKGASVAFLQEPSLLDINENDVLELILTNVK